MATERSGILWLVLDQSSSASLRAAVPSLYSNEFYHHVTLRYGVTAREVSEFIGKRVTIIATAVAYNDQAQAVRVTTGGLPDEYGVPHITLSTAKGVKPFASVAMLQGAHEEALLDPSLQLSGIVEFKSIDDIKG